ncbi:MAG: SusD/RagB family nutrient-binding outer membrane lipoprotein [Bacteroidota bacterium]
MIRKKYLYVVLMAGILSSACTKNFEEINSNPNNPNTSDEEYVFNYVLKEGAGEYGFQNTYNITYVQRWIMQTAAVWGNSTMPPYTLFDQYRIQNLWSYYYSNLLLNCTVLEDMTADDPEDMNKHQVARIWKAYCFHRVTDIWGDVPYSEAWKLLDEYSQENISPAYDTQEDIYADLLAILENAASTIDPSETFYANDMLFDGDLDLWIRFANSLRLRLAVRSGNQQVVAQLILEENLMRSSDESALFHYIEDQIWWNPYYELNVDSKNPSNPELTGTSSPKISELMTRQLEETVDPRLAILAQPMELDNMTYRGVPNLMNSTIKENQAMGMGVSSTSYIGLHFTNNPIHINPVLTYAEVCFLRAEAAFRGWTTENAQQWYEEGIKNAITYYGISEEDADLFLLGNGAYDNTLEQIMVQKWIALFLNGWEAWADYRRTGFPQLKKWDLVLDGIKIKSAEWVDIPRDYLPGRLPYPDDELDLNKDNYEAAVNNQGGDSYYQQVWWSRKFGEIGY